MSVSTSKRRSWLWFFVMSMMLPGFIGSPPAGAELTAFETDDFSGSGVCAFCHSQLRDAAGNDVSNDAHWRSSMMANAAKDPFWQAKISAEVALQASPELKQAIEEKCSRCHMGMARYQQLTDGGTQAEISVLGSGFLNPTHYLHEAAMDGVSCTLCHQIQPGNLGTPDSFTGQYEIDVSAAKPDKSLFGPYPNPRLNPMQRNSGFRPVDHAPGDQMADSALCGTCHTLYTPSLSATGEYLGEFPEQTTYLEWEHSRSLQTCQDCHLPDAVGAVTISNRPRRRLPARQPFGQHHFVGGNHFMVSLLRDHAADLGITASTGHMDATLSRTLDQLERKTASLSAAVSLVEGGNTLLVTVDVTNLAGHKFPSGLPSRRAWLHLTVTDADNNLVFESGRPLADGSIAGNDADADAATFEPHYDEITAADQVQIYEPVMRNSDGQVTYTLLRAWEYAKDNRLLPAGFDKSGAAPDIGVYGAAAEDTDFIGGSDRVVYRVNVADGASAFTVRAALLFQSLSSTFVEDLRNTPTPEVDRFMTLYDQQDNYPVVVADTQVTAQ